MSRAQLKQNLRYKDYRLVVKPAAIAWDTEGRVPPSSELGVLREVDSVKTFSQIMIDRGILQWWRRGMGYGDDHL